MLKVSDKTQHLKQSGIRAASTRCTEMGGINLGQGVCDIPTPEIIKQAAYQAIANDQNIYGPYEGVLALRQAISRKLASFNHIIADPINEIIVTHGSTGAFVCATMTLYNPGDEVILFEPFYGYHKGILELNGITVKTVPLNLNDFSFDLATLKKAIGPRTKGIVICTPCNPSGKVYSREELIEIGNLAEQHNLSIITDEIYEYITYPGYEHVSIASLENFKERTITISGFSKTYNMTGWRLGYATGPAAIINKMGLVHDLFYICPPTPLQHAVIAAFSLDESYYQNMNQKYLHKRDHVINTLETIGFKTIQPQGAYYLLVNFKSLGFKDDEEAAKRILEKAKVATVPGRAFYLNPDDGKYVVRLCFALNEDKISLAMDQLKAAYGMVETTSV
jgi:aminotransferase